MKAQIINKIVYKHDSTTPGFRSRIKSGITVPGDFVFLIINSFKQNIFCSRASTLFTVIPDLIRDLKIYPLSPNPSYGRCPHMTTTGKP
jgi:hypothetical protein